MMNINIGHSNSHYNTDNEGAHALMNYGPKFLLS